EHVRQDVVERVLDQLVVALAARLGELAPALEVGMVELVVGRLLLDEALAELSAQAEEAVLDVLVGQGLDLGFQLVGLVDERLDPLQLTVVRIDEPGKETKHGSQSIWASVRGTPTRLPNRPCAASDANHVRAIQRLSHRLKLTCAWPGIIRERGCNF